MDARFAPNPQSNGFKNLICHEGFATDTVFGCFSTSKGVKRKWDLRNGSMEMEDDQFPCLWLGRSSSSSDSKASSATGSTTMASSPKETDEESSMDLELDFSLHLDLESSLSSTTSESDISIAHPNHNYKKIPEDSSLSSRGGRRCQKPDSHKGAEGRTAYGGGRRCWWGPPGSDVCNLFGRGKSGLCTFHGALVEDKRVHGGGSTVGTLVHDAQEDENAIMTEDMDVDTVVMTSSRRPSLASEGRVHGGSMIAYVASRSGWSTDQQRVNLMS